MTKIGLFFGTDSGTTRLIGKKIATKLGSGMVDKPLNINRATVEDLMKYSVLILGTATYGEGDLPGVENNVKSGSWLDFIPQLEGLDFSGKTIAFYGVGNQEKYGDRFVNGMGKLYAFFKAKGATVIGSWSTEGYTYNASSAVIDGKFVGLAIDNKSQAIETEPRLNKWTEVMKPQFINALEQG